MKLNDIVLDEVIYEDKKGAKRIEISNLDLLLMVWLDKFSFVNCSTFDYGEVKYDRVTRRMAKLYEYGYVDRERPNMYFKYDYRLKPKGMRFLLDYYYRQFTGVEFDRRSVAKYNQLQSQHQNLCARIGWLLLMNGYDSTDIISDRDMKTFRYDMKRDRNFEVLYKKYSFLKNAGSGDVVLAVADKLYISIEVERTWKGKDRTKEKVNRYSNKNCLGIVWVIPDNRKRMRDTIEDEMMMKLLGCEFCSLDSNAEEVIGAVQNILDKRKHRIEEKLQDALADEQKEQDDKKHWENRKKCEARGLGKDELDRLPYSFRPSPQQPTLKDYLADDVFEQITDVYFIPALIRNFESIKKYNTAIEEASKFTLNKEKREKNQNTISSNKNWIRHCEAEIDAFLKSVPYQGLPEEQKNKIKSIIEQEKYHENC